MTMKFYKIEITSKGRKLLPLKNRNWTNLRLTGGKSKLTCKRADGNLAKKRPLRRLVPYGA